MKIGSVDAPRCLRVTVRAGIRRSGRERQRGGRGAAAAGEEASAPTTSLPRPPVSANPAAPAPAPRSSCRRVMLWPLASIDSPKQAN